MRRLYTDIIRKALFKPGEITDLTQLGHVALLQETFNLHLEITRMHGNPKQILLVMHITHTLLLIQNTGKYKEPKGNPNRLGNQVPESITGRHRQLTHYVIMEL